MRSSKLSAVGTISLGCIFAASLSTAQDTGGLQGFATVGQSLIYSDNPELDFIGDSEALTRTDLTLGLLSETRASSVRFQISGAFEVGDRTADESAAFVDPAAEFTFTQSSRNSALSFSASYVESDVTDVLLSDPGSIGTDVLSGTGTRTINDVSFSFDSGLATPFNYGFDVSHRETDFSVLTDPDLTPETETEINGRLSFRVSPVLTLGLRATDIDFEADDVTDTQRDTQRVVFDGTYQLRDGLSLTAGISDSEVTTVRTTGTEVTEGIGGSLGFLLDRPNGTLEGSLTSEIEDTGRINTLEFTRAMELRAGTLSFGAGVVDTRTGIDPLFNVEYRQELPTGLFRLSLSQVTSVNDDSEDVISSALSLGYERPINEVSRWDAGLTMAQTDIVGVDEDSQRLDLSLAYRRDIGPDWDLVSSYTYSRLREDGAADRDSNTVSISLERSFSFRP